MSAILLIPAFLSFLLLAAHFLRMGSIFMAIFALLFPFALFIKRPWAARLVQIALFLGGIEWVYTLMQFVIERHEAGQPWIRLLIILGAVIILTIGSASIFSFSSRLRKRYGLSNEITEENNFQT